MLAVEGVVILKLIADRTQDAADVESINVAQPDFDQDYMVRWFEEFGALDLAGRSGGAKPTQSNGDCFASRP